MTASRSKKKLFSGSEAYLSFSLRSSSAWRFEFDDKMLIWLVFLNFYFC